LNTKDSEVESIGQSRNKQIVACLRLGRALDKTSEIRRKNHERTDSKKNISKKRQTLGQDKRKKGLGAHLV